MYAPYIVITLAQMIGFLLLLVPAAIAVFGGLRLSGFRSKKVVFAGIGAAVLVPVLGILCNALGVFSEILAAFQWGIGSMIWGAFKGLIVSGGLVNVPSFALLFVTLLVGGAAAWVATRPENEDKFAAA